MSSERVQLDSIVELHCETKILENLILCLIASMDKVYPGLGPKTAEGFRSVEPEISEPREAARVLIAKHRQLAEKLENLFNESNATQHEGNTK